MSLPKVNFLGALDGTTVNDLNKKVDYTKNKLQERTEVVNDILSSTSFYQEYFDNYFKTGLNANDCLSSEVNVCRSLEKMASYLLNSKEVKQEEDAGKLQYVFYTDRDYFEKKVNREISLEALGNAENSDHEATIIHFFKRQDRNSKKPKKNQKISKKDLDRSDDLGEILRDYNKYLEVIDSELRNKNSNYNRYILAKNKGSIVDDMIYTKDHMLGVFGYELKNTNESTKYDLDVFDFTNEIHLKGTTIVTSKGKRMPVKGLIFFKPDFNPDDEMSYVIYDLQQTIDKAGLTNEEKEILDLLRNGLSKSEIARQLNINHVKVFRTIEGIVKKIIAVGNKYDYEEI